MVKRSLREEKDKLVLAIGQCVDLRTSFGKQVLDRALRLKGPRRTALRELLSRLKLKGAERLSEPVKFVFQGYESGKKHEIVGESIARPKLRYMYRYSIALPEARAGYRETIGQMRSLGEIEVGKVLRKELPVLFPVLGDERYEEFFKHAGRERREREVRDTLGERVERILDEIAKQGYDVAELKPVLMDFLISQINLQKGSDLYWLRRQIDEGKVQDEKLKRAIDNVFENPDYTKEDSILVGESIMELRKRSTIGLIGSLKDDLLFLDKNQEIYEVNLDRHFSRRRFYPERGRIEEGTIRGKLKAREMSFAEALGILESFPGILQVRRDFNRNNAMNYFSADGDLQAAVSNLNKAFEFILPYLARDREEYHEAKKSRRKADLFLKREYGIAKEIDEITTLDKTKGNWANITTWTKMQDSRRIFSGLYTIVQKIKLAKKLEEDGNGKRAAGVMSSAYDNAVNFEQQQGISLEEAVDRIVAVDINKDSKADRKRANKAGTTLTAYQKFRKENPGIEQEVSFGIVPSKLADKIAKFYQIVKDYYGNKGDLRKKIGFMFKLRDYCGLATLPRLDFKLLSEQQYLSPEEKKLIERMHTKVVKNKSLKGLIDFQNLRELEKNWQEIRKYKEKKIYGTQEKMLIPLHEFMPIDDLFEWHGNIGFIEPNEIKKRHEEIKKCVETYKTAVHLGEQFLIKLKVVAENTSKRHDNLEFNHRVKVNRNFLDEFISEVEKTPQEVLVSDELIDGVDRVYHIIESYKQMKEEGKIEDYKDVLEEGSIAQLKKGNSYDISAYSLDTEDPTGDLIKSFSKRHGGVGYLRWDRERGWHAEGISRGRLEDLARDLKKRNADVRLKIDKVYR